MIKDNFLSIDIWRRLKCLVDCLNYNADSNTASDKTQQMTLIVRDAGLLVCLFVCLGLTAHQHNFGHNVSMYENDDNRDVLLNDVEFQDEIECPRCQH